MVIVRSHAVCHPYTMVILPRNACLAITAMLAPRRLGEFTCAALTAWVKYDTVIWVASHFLFMILRCNKRLGNNTCIQKYVWKNHDWRYAYPVDSWNPRPCNRKKHIFSYNKQGRKENLKIMSTQTAYSGLRWKLTKTSGWFSWNT